MNYLSSTIGKKLLVGLAGLGLSLFVLVHMMGNLFLFVGQEAFNKYAHALTSNPLIYVAEVGLVSIFLLHIVLALYLTWKNKDAKGSRYAKAAKRTSASFSSRTIHYQGIIILAFVVYHLITFKYGPHYEITHDGILMRDIFTVVVDSFQNPLIVGAYVFTVILLCLHLSHGLASSLQTLGLNGEKYDSKVKLVGNAYAAIVTLGFVSQPIFVFFFH